MSTRATYQFQDAECRSYNVKATIYVHYDGYPEGAAVYFYRTLCNPSKGNLATQFVRAIPHAELTHSHKAHGDTEFQYDVVGTGPEAHIEAYAIPFDNKPRQPIFSGKLHQFIEKYSRDIDDYSPFVFVNYTYRSRWLNRETARRLLHQPYGPVVNLTKWSENLVPGQEKSANWKGAVSDILALVTVFPELRTAEIDRLLSL